MISKASHRIPMLEFHSYTYVIYLIIFKIWKIYIFIQKKYYSWGLGEHPSLSEPGTQFLWKYFILSRVCFTHISSSLKVLPQMIWDSVTTRSSSVWGRRGIAGYRPLMSNFSGSQLTWKLHVIFSVTFLTVSGRWAGSTVGMTSHWLNMG